MPEHPPRLTAEELESLREATLQRYVAADHTYAEIGRLRAYTDEPDGGLINLIDMAIELTRSHEAALARIAELEAELDRLRERRRTWLLRFRTARDRVAELEAQQQPRVIETPEDAAALPRDAVVVAHDTRVWIKDGDRDWVCASTGEGAQNVTLPLPATVLHIPTEEARDGEPAMASDRDTPAALPRVLHRAIDQSLADLFTDWDLSQGLPAPVTVAVHIERDLRAAGWRPPAREITDLAELDGLPVGSIVREIGVDAGRALAWRKCVHSRARAPFCWEEFGTSLRSQSSEISLPVIVLWTPEQEGGR
ncbi:hypothetical protein IU418_13400 [Nocardia farcinica]|uniref:hypothetical protein n=1 Tax=Nocardia farcinica TaxID=37329 RepID=UPI001B3C7B1B|nr:hypothetical protein [Nocardia farcinica]MBF6538200.1 hypothetical protein [Nocardia farcinica]